MKTETMSCRSRVIWFCACLIVYGTLYYSLYCVAPKTYIIVTGTVQYFLIISLLWIIFKPLKRV